MTPNVAWKGTKKLNKLRKNVYFSFADTVKHDYTYIILWTPSHKTNSNDI